MSIRFIEATEEAYELTKKVRNEFFPLLEKAVIKVLFDTKIRKSNNKIVLGSIRRADDLIRRLTDDLSEEGCDYIMFLDQVAFENIPDIDKTRLIRHELRHCKVTGTVEKPKYNLIPHDIEDFLIEVELNKDDVGWCKNAVQLVSDIYEQLEESRKEKEAAEKETPKKQPEPLAEGRKLFRRAV
jgi:hypothetical protein